MRPMIAILIACSAALHAAAEAQFADIAQPDLAQAVAGKQVVLIDANGTESWKAGHIPGAIDFATAKADLAKQLPADKSALIVAYCGGPACGAWKSAAKAAAELGYTNIRHFSGGISGWKESGAAIEVAKAE